MSGHISTIISSYFYNNTKSYRSVTKTRANNCLKSMRHAPETSTINQLHFSGAGSGTVSRKSRTGFACYQILAPIRALFYSKPKSGTHVTEMMTYNWLTIIVYVFMCCKVAFHL